MQLHDILHGILHRFRLSHLKKYHKERHVLALFTFLNACLSIALIGLLAYVSNSSFLFPSLGPTAFLLFYKPLAAASSPRNTLWGHFIGMLVGWLIFQLFEHQGNVVGHGDAVTWNVIGAASLSIGFTFGLMVLFNVAHPPAGATTLIVALGVVTSPGKLPVLWAGVLLLVLQAFLINRFAGVQYPLWKPKPPKN